MSNYRLHGNKPERIQSDIFEGRTKTFSMKFKIIHRNLSTRKIITQFDDYSLLVLKPSTRGNGSWDRQSWGSNRKSACFQSKLQHFTKVFQDFLMSASQRMSKTSKFLNKNFGFYIWAIQIEKFHDFHMTNGRKNIELSKIGVWSILIHKKANFHRPAVLAKF